MTKFYSLNLNLHIATSLLAKLCSPRQCNDIINSHIPIIHINYIINFFLIYNWKVLKSHINWKLEGRTSSWKCIDIIYTKSSSISKSNKTRRSYSNTNKRNDALGQLLPQNIHRDLYSPTVLLLHLEWNIYK